jgi:hypothetical protein
VDFVGFVFVGFVFVDFVDAVDRICDNRVFALGVPPLQFIILNSSFIILLQPPSALVPAQRLGNALGERSLCNKP